MRGTLKMANIEITKKVTIHLEGEEIEMLKALCQNPHPQYQTSEELMTFAGEMFNTLKSMLGTPTYRPYRERVMDKLKQEVDGLD
jgi:hypothetical protein